MAAEAKARGNAAFSAGRYEEAVAEFDTAIELDPENHVLYSNRSGAHASLKSYHAALRDADKCIELNPSFAKGYTRKGLALVNLSRHEDASAAYKKGGKPFCF